MPSKNIYKVFAEGAYYHVYNRGVEKREIFQDQEDYFVFINNLKRYLEPGFLLERKDPKTKKPIFVTPNYSYDKITLMSFCLMPNHFHLLVKLKKQKGLTDLMKKVCTNYTNYFNEKNDRIGKLCQAIYKAVPVTTGEHFLHLSRYIHLNPLEMVSKSSLKDYRFSSYYYINKNIKEGWLCWDEVLGDMTVARYKDFVESYIDSPDVDEIKKPYIDNLLLE